MIASLEGPKRPEGWVKPTKAKRFHYIVDGESLCKGFLFEHTDLEPDNGQVNAKQDCPTCSKGVARLRKEGKMPVRS